MSTNANDDHIEITTSTTPKAAKPPANGDPKMRRSGSFGIFKAALLMFRGRTKKTKKSKRNLAGNGNWTDIVGSVRPLHLTRIDQSPSFSPASTHDSEKLTGSVYEDMSPFEASPAWSSSCGTSKYASASCLLDLVDDEGGDPDEVFDAITGDEMIDAKADEFIAQFYKQIQIQNTGVVHHQRHRTI